MRYRAKSDFVSTDPEGQEVFVAMGDKVFVQQVADMWEIYSFYSRKSIGRFNKEDLLTLFGPEHEVNRPPKDNRFIGRKFGNMVIIGLLMLLPTLSMAQVNPITWSWKAVRVDATHFEFQIKADISRGWWIYAPNRQEECLFSPIVTFERSSVMKPVEKVVVLEYLMYANNEGTDGVYPSFCSIPQYRNSVVFMQLFKMPSNSCGTVKGQIIFQAMSRYTTTPLAVIDFELNVGAEPIYRYEIFPRDPKGFFRKTWWFIKHPFGSHYTRKRHHF